MRNTIWYYSEIPDGSNWYLIKMRRILAYVKKYGVEIKIQFGV